MQRITSTGNSFKTFRIKTIPLMLALAMSGIARAQESAGEAILSEVKVFERVLGEKTEGTASYTTGKARTATPLSLSPRDTPQSVSVMTQQRI